MMRTVALIAPSQFSNVARATLYLLDRSGLDIPVVIVRRIANFKRLKQEFKRDGRRLLRKVYRKLVLRSAENPITGAENIVSYMADQDMTARSIRDFCAERSIPLVFVDDINEPRAQRALETGKPDCVAFTGGGLVRADIMRLAGAGVVNCHMGILPYYRGMDVVQWPILYGQLDQVGMTAHVMDKGIDTGGILMTRHVYADQYESLAELRNAIEMRMPELLAECCRKLVSGEIAPRAQAIDEGVQHFKMNDRLSPHVDQLLSAAFSGRPSESKDKEPEKPGGSAI